MTGISSELNCNIFNKFLSNCSFHFAPYLHVQKSHKTVVDCGGISVLTCHFNDGITLFAYDSMAVVARSTFENSADILIYHKTIVKDSKVDNDHI